MKMKKIFPESLGQKRDFALYTAKYGIFLKIFYSLAYRERRREG